MMSNCQPSLRAIASAFGTLGDSMNPNRSVNVEKAVADLLQSHALGRINSRRGRCFDGEDNVFLMQHFVVLQTVHQRSRRVRRIAGQEYGSARHPVRRPLFKHCYEIGERKL